MPVKIIAGIDGLPELKKALEVDEILGEQWGVALDEAASVLEDNMKATAPRGKTGNLVGSIKRKVQSRMPPMWAKVSSNVTVKGGRGKRRPGEKAFRYGWALNYSKRIPYRDLTHGGLTWHWVERALLQSSGQIRRILDSAAKAIQAGWSF